jgi:hypothetical protein
MFVPYPGWLDVCVARQHVRLSLQVFSREAPMEDG